MERRDFLTMAGVAGMGFLFPRGLRGDGSRRLKNWVWLHGVKEKNNEKILKMFEFYRSRGVHGLLVMEKPSVLEKISPLAAKVGIELHVWRWTMNRGEYMKKRPEWYAVNRNGDSVIDKPPYVGYYRWLCPSREQVRETIVADYARLRDLDGVSGVHLDYVRYCDVILPKALQPKYNLKQEFEMPEFDYCYCPVCKEKFKEKTGINLNKVKNPDKCDEWRDFRLERLIDLVNLIVREVEKKKKTVTAAVFPSPKIAKRLVRQDWSRFNCHAFMPMLYFNDYYGDLTWVRDRIREGRAVLKDDQKLYAGLHVEHVRKFGMERVVSLCLENGVDGISFFTGRYPTETEWNIFESIMGGY